MPSPATIVGISDDTERGKKRSWVPPRDGRLGPVTAVLRGGSAECSSEVGSMAYARVASSVIAATSVATATVATRTTSQCRVTTCRGARTAAPTSPETMTSVSRSHEASRSTKPRTATTASSPNDTTRYDKRSAAASTAASLVADHPAIHGVSPWSQNSVSTGRSRTRASRNARSVEGQ